jgi:hypothetical protein
MITENLHEKKGGIFMTVPFGYQEILRLKPQQCRLDRGQWCMCYDPKYLFFRLVDKCVHWSQIAYIQILVLLLVSFDILWQITYPFCVPLDSSLEWKEPHTFLIRLLDKDV